MPQLAMPSSGLLNRQLGKVGLAAKASGTLFSPVQAAQPVPFERTSMSFDRYATSLSPLKMTSLAQPDFGWGSQAAPPNILGGQSGPAPSFGGAQGFGGAAGNVGGDWSGVEQWSDAINSAASTYGVDPNLIKAIMKLESNGDPNAAGAAGVWGPMQVNAKAWGYGPWMSDPVANIMKGAEILKTYLDENGGNMREALRHYHGIGFDGYTTDEQYADTVLGNYQQLPGGAGTNANGAVAPIDGMWGGNPVGHGLVNEALKFQGVSYVWGSIPGAGQDPWQTGWDCCIIKGMRVYGPDGPKKIEEVKPGDRVWSFVDRKIVSATVTNAWFSRRQPVFRVRTRGRSIVASANHPFLVVRSDKLTGGRVDPARTEWVRLDELKRGDYLVTLERPVERQGKEIEPDIAWVCGLFLGDGCVHGTHNGVKSYVHISVFGETAERAISILRKQSGNVGIIDPQKGVLIGSKKLVRFFQNLDLDHPAHEKRVPSEIWTWSSEAQRSFLDGYCAADGHRPKGTNQGHIVYVSCSQDLAEEVRALHLSLGDNAGVVTKSDHVVPVVIKGVTVKNARPRYMAPIYPQRSSGVPGTKTERPEIDRFVASGDGRWGVRPILGIDAMGDEDTYDIEVEGIGNFVAEGFVVHNSGFTYYMNQRYGDKSIPQGSHYQFAYAQQSGRLFTDLSQLQPGDLVFINTGWQGGAGAELNQAGHVGIYIGNGQMIHAANPSTGTIVSPISGYGNILGGMHQGGSSGGGALPAGGGNPFAGGTGYGSNAQSSWETKFRNAFTSGF